MDSRLKTVLAVVAGVVIGVTLLGGAFAAHAVMGTIAYGRGAVTQGYGMMGQRQGFDGAEGMMGQRGRGFGTSEAYGECPSGGICSEGGCSGTGQGMMDPRGGYQRGPQDGTGTCPNSDVCPNVTDEATTES